VKRVLPWVLTLLVATSARAEPLRNGGPYGGIALSGSLAPFGSGNELEIHCIDLGAADCSTPIPVGVGLNGYAGFARGRFGLEGFLAVQGDLHRPSARYDGVTHRPFGNPLFSNPPREESFIILRGGAVLAPRIRYTIEEENLRYSFAAGVGVAYRYSALVREVTGDGGVEDRPYFPSGVGYVSPALSLDSQLQIRSTATLAIVFGLGMLFETAGSDTKTAEDPTRTVAGDRNAFPIATPPYALSSGIQYFLLPYVGLAFGP
jgi:hypothetical protein